MAPRFAVLLGLVLPQAHGQAPTPGGYMGTPDITVPLCVSNISSLIATFEELDPEFSSYDYGFIYYIRANDPTATGFNFIIWWLPTWSGYSFVIDEFGGVYDAIAYDVWLGPGCDPSCYSLFDGDGDSIVEKVSAVFNLIQNDYGIDGTCYLSTSASPSSSPSAMPSLSASPSSSPSAMPSLSPPTRSPTLSPTPSPTTSPTVSPTSAPTSSPTHAPTSTPTRSPTLSPTPSSTSAPTSATTPVPTSSPTLVTTTSPTSVSPSSSPSAPYCPPCPARRHVLFGGISSPDGCPPCPE